MRIHRSLGSWGILVTVIEIAMAYFKARAFGELTFAKISGTVTLDREIWPMAVCFTQQNGQKERRLQTLVRVKSDRAITCVLCLDFHLT